MKLIFFLSLFIFSINLSAQDGFVRTNCGHFKLNISSNIHKTINFLSEESYRKIIKDSIQKRRMPTIKENTDLYKEFQKNFPDKLTRHCVNSKFFQNDSIVFHKFCDSATTLILTSKEYNFYIFKVKAFEVGNYLLFNTHDQTIYSTSNYPLILDNGKTVFDIGYAYGGFKTAKYYRFNDKKTEYFNFSIPPNYSLKDFKIIDDKNRKKIVVDIITYQLKKSEPGSKFDYENDVNDYCRKFLLID
ncbi:hypothetical protein [Chryseobacterium sp. JUb7]|uniref:hypothetical protein n=1 Tax=Chryseobacterium sp. JUb7 TaxID=2940599 RepID=UPI002169E204|nr:hypothetical protein [Chryseobacterium sp. JUb7]MCS3531876.1 hypothetical protein [Chryseobacterium sp. JUb7]